MRNYSTCILARTLPGVAPVPRLDARGTLDPRDQVRGWHVWRRWIV